MSNAKLPQRQASIILFGRLTRDPELKWNNEKANCGFALAVERWTGTERVSWFANCRVFGKAAEKFAESARKGDPVYVTGEPYVEEWTTRENEKRKDLKVFVNTVDLLAWPEEQTTKHRHSDNQASQQDEESVPF